MKLWVKSVLGFLALSACAATPYSTPEQRIERAAPLSYALPPMKVFSGVHRLPARRSNVSVARDFLDLSFQLESGRPLLRFTRFEGPVTVRVTGDAPPSLGPDLARLLQRLRNEAGIPIRRASTSQNASITIDVIPRKQLQGLVPDAACFVAPGVSDWTGYKRNRNAPLLDWTRLETRDRLAIFIPGDVAPQEIRDCLHEELAQALGPLNDLYRLSDSIFNDDNFQTVLTSFDMLILRTYYSPDLYNGMSQAQVAARLPAILARLNPEGGATGIPRGSQRSKVWDQAVRNALNPGSESRRRLTAARNAVRIATDNNWQDGRLAFSLYLQGRFSIGREPGQALSSFLRADQIFRARPGSELQSAHVAMQLAAFALRAGQARTALDMVNANLEPVKRAENAALLATLLMIKAEALDLLGQADEAQSVRLDSLGWARYGFGSDAEVRERAGDIAALAPGKTRVQYK